ncbi:MAG: hypothetical protein JW751_02705 [Polyangiaceae bacterium]|nr:hypothetical protein [Polyangiaceae bacterium]
MSLRRIARALGRYLAHDARLRGADRSRRRTVLPAQRRGRTLLELGRDDQCLGGELRLTLVLHTWSRDP